MNLLNSLRGRLAVVSAIVIAMVLTIAGAGLYWLFANYIESNTRRELKARVIELAGAFDLDPSGKPQLNYPPSDPRYLEPYSGVYWYVRDNQLIFLRSRSLWDSLVSGPSNSPGQVVEGNGPSGTTVLMLERPIHLGQADNSHDFILGVALDRAELDGLTSSFGWYLVSGLGLVGTLLLVSAWLQASYGLKPLEKVRAELSSLRRGDKEKLEGPFPAEIEPLTHDLNALFARQKDMILRGRERAGRLAHGLKTPMTVLYGEARKLERSGNDVQAKSIREHLDMMQNQLNRELSRARTHGESAGLGLQADVSATSERIAELMRRMPRGDQITWVVPPPGTYAAMDPDDLGEILGNLLDNARVWAKSEVRIAAITEPASVRLSVSDDGPGIDQEKREKLLQRGEGNSGGSGLGLAIVGEILATYGTSLVLGRSELGGLKASMYLPNQAATKN